MSLQRPAQVKLAQPLSSTHEVFSIEASPLLIGWPVRRSRLFSTGLNKTSVLWVGPDQEHLQEDFERFFAASLEATADVFLAALDSEVYEEKQRLAKARGCHLPDFADATARPVDLAQIYAPGQLLRMAEYSRLRAEAMSSSWFADLEQSAGRGASTPGQCLLSMLTHGTLHAWTGNRPVTTLELYLAHGYNVWPDRTRNSMACRISQMLRTLPTKDQKLLLGNCWHVPVLGSWVMYVLAHTVKRPAVRINIQAEKNFLQRGGTGRFSHGEITEAADSTATEGASASSNPAIPRRGAGVKLELESVKPVNVKLELDDDVDESSDQKRRKSS